MSLNSTYYFAEKARNKLRKETSNRDVDLRKVACLGNLFDSLNLSIDKYERERKNTRQQSWFNEMLSDVDDLDQDYYDDNRGTIITVQQLDRVSPPRKKTTSAATSNSNPIPQIGLLQI